MILHLPSLLLRKLNSVNIKRFINPLPTNLMESKIRIFIAYSFDDKKEVDKIVELFRKMERFDILWNEEITPGVKFSEVPRDLIAFSHVLVPIISIASLKSGGYIRKLDMPMALNIPVLPISLI